MLNIGKSRGKFQPSKRFPRAVWGMLSLCSQSAAFHFNFNALLWLWKQTPSSWWCPGVQGRQGCCCLQWQLCKSLSLPSRPAAGSGPGSYQHACFALHAAALKMSFLEPSLLTVRVNCGVRGIALCKSASFNGFTECLSWQKGRLCSSSTSLLLSVVVLFLAIFLWFSP